MADTRLILHVKGTESETQEMPKEVVKTAVAEGKISYSQLVWSAPDHAWKQVRELPDLLPAESLILHVKGTVSETREMPRQALKNAISRGEISQSQLIWSTSDSTWKQVREIPDLLPGETMILHVKGTEADTRELPKPAIRAAIQKGEITQSQLIWSPLDSAWKPVSEMPELAPGESLILHVKGTTSDTSEMPKKAIRTAIKEGKITHSQLIWSAGEHQWKQVRELPELLPSQKLAPAPERRSPVPMLETVEPETPVVRPVVAVATPAATPKARPAVVAPPRVTIGSATAASPQPKVAQPAIAVQGQTPAVRVAANPQAAQTPKMVAAVVPQTMKAAQPAVAKYVQGSSGPHEGHVVEEHDDGFHPVKWICIILGAIVLGIVLVNYVLIERPLGNNMSTTSYANITTYGHYGAFVQPNVMVIHIRPSDKLTADNITDFLVALANSTPKNPITGDYFDRVAITPGWTAKYSFAGSAWKTLGDMKGDSVDDIRTQILSNAYDAGGQRVLGETTMNEEAQEARRDAAWKEFVASFAKSGS